jgi:tetratricopeptide (TPR) repeat protein
VRAVERARELGVDGMTTLLIASLLSSPFAARNEFDGWQRTHEVALSTARGTGDRRAEAIVLTGLGQLYYEKDDFPAALAFFRQASAYAEEVGDDATRAVAVVGIGTVRRDLAEFAEAAADLELAVALGEQVGDQSVVAAAHYGLGAISRDHGDLDAAADRFRLCAARYRDLADRRGEALAMRGLSLCHRALGDLRRPQAQLGRGRTRRRLRPAVVGEGAVAHGGRLRGARGAGRVPAGEHARR